MRATVFLTTVLPVAAIVAASAPAAADVPASFTWSAPMSCPTREDAIERLRKTRGASGEAPPIDADVVITQEDESRFTASVRLVANHEWTKRSLEASTCSAIVDALLVILDVAMSTTPGPPPSPEPPPAPAKAPPAPYSPPRLRETFGVGRQLVFTADMRASVTMTGDSMSSILFAPTVDVFLGRGFSLGATLFYEHTQQVVDAPPAINGSTVVLSYTEADTNLGAGVRAGYDIDFGNQVSLWPVVSVACGQSWLGDGTARDKFGEIGAFVPLLFHPVPHAFIGFGPDGGVDVLLFERGAPTFEYGLKLTLGGWVGLGG